MNIPPKYGEISAAAVLISMVERHPSLSEAELMRFANQRGLRAGALPVRSSLQMLKELGLVIGAGQLGLSATGGSCAKLLGGQEEPTPKFRDLLVALSLATDEARAVLANVRIDESGRVSDPRGIAASIFDYFAETGVMLAVPDGTWRFVNRARTLSLGTLLAVGDDVQDGVDLAAIGDRGERLSLLYEFDRTGKWPMHVSQISNWFGFDLQSIEDRESVDEIAIEVKATARQRLLVNWSAKEALTALLLEGSYVLHIWGGVDLNSSLDDDYARLRHEGYPRIVRNPAALVRHVIVPSSDWVAIADSRIRTSNFQWEFGAGM